MCTLLTLSNKPKAAVRENGFQYDTLGPYIFKDPHLLIEALHPYHGKPIRIGGKVAREGNQSLAWLGDGVLAVALKVPWYSGPQTRGYSNKHWFTETISNKRLAELADRDNIARCCFGWPPGAEMGPEAKATIVEALIGAVYLDSGFDIRKVQAVMEAIGLTCPAQARGPECDHAGLVEFNKSSDGDPKALLDGTASKAAVVARGVMDVLKSLKLAERQKWAEKQVRSSTSKTKRKRLSSRRTTKAFKRLGSVRKVEGYVRSAQLSLSKARVCLKALSEASSTEESVVSRSKEGQSMVRPSHV